MLPEIDTILLAAEGPLPALGKVVMAAGILFVVGLVVLIIKCYRKVNQGEALVRNGMGGTKVCFTGTPVVPVIHKSEIMDISVKRIEINRQGKDGLICKDNIRADIKVVYFVRVNNEEQDVKRVASAIGCERASSQREIQDLFDAKFSEALKTVGKRFDFAELYQERDTFREEILKIIGTDLNGFVLDDCAIDHLEQTSLDMLNPDNILDSEGIKKITDLTAEQAKLANQIDRDKERVIRQQDVEAEEAILELNRQLAESTAKQEREIASVQAREEAEALKVGEEERLKSERARIATEEELEIATQNKDRQVIVAERNKERTDVVEAERVERDRMLEEIERDRMTALKGIERDKAVEIEKKNIQDVIKERVAVEKTVVEEQEKIKDTEAFAGADREKQVKITLAEMEAEEALVKQIKDAEAAKESAQLKADEELYSIVKAAEAQKQAAELHADEIIIAAEADQAAADKTAVAKKTLAEATAAESAATGLGEAQVIEAKATASQKQGTAEAKVIELKALAEAKGITEKADAMKKFDGEGREHEEFRLGLEKAKVIELADLDAQKDIASRHSEVVGTALENANVDIIGGDTVFFDKIAGAVTTGKAVDRALSNSRALTDVKETFFNGDPEYFQGQLRRWLDDYGFSTEDLKNLTVSAALGQMITAADDSGSRSKMEGLLEAAKRYGMANLNAGSAIKQITK